MKKTIITLMLAFIVSASMAQSKTTKDTTKQKYDYFVKVPAGDFNQLTNLVNEAKRLQMYDPTLQDGQKVQFFQNVESYLRELPKRVKLDSVKIETPKTK